MNIRIRCFPYALKNSRRCRGVLKFKYTDSSIVAKTDYGNFQFTLNQDKRVFGEVLIKHVIGEFKY